MYCGRGSREKVLFLEAESLKAMRSETAVQSLAEQLENTHKKVTKKWLRACQRRKQSRLGCYVIKDSSSMFLSIGRCCLLHRVLSPVGNGLPGLQIQS